MDEVRLPAIDGEELQKALRREFESCIEEVTKAVNDARAGAVIDESEEPVRKALSKLRQQVFGKALQMKTDAASAAFSPRKRKGEKVTFSNKGKQTVGHDTVNGNIRLSRTRWWSRDYGCDETLDRLIGIAAATVSIGVRQMCCRVAISQPGFDKAAQHLSQLAQIRISPERLRVIGQCEGRRVLDVQAAGGFVASFLAGDCQTASNGPRRLYMGVDGVKVPMVTAEEKSKRRKNRGKKRVGSRPRRMRRGADNRYKEFKIATFYDETNDHRQVTATSGDHKVLGRLVRREAGRLELGQADEKVAVVDGADWIRNQLNRNVPILDAIVLDFYHLSEHIWSAGNTCFGQDSEPAKTFAGKLLDLAKHEGVAALLAEIESTRKPLRSATKRKALTDLLNYIGPRAAMCDYPSFVEKGWQIGSGPTEAMCKVLTYRLKGPGMRWDRPCPEAIMALIALQQSNTWKSYWDSQKRAA